MSSEPNSPILTQVCRQMRPFISPAADGTLKGLLRWYVQVHISRCPQCIAVLTALRVLRERLADLGANEISGIMDRESGTPTESDPLSTEMLMKYVEQQSIGGHKSDENP